MKISELLDALRTQIGKGLTGAVALVDFIRNRVQPLKQRHNYAFEFLGSKDPSRSSPRDMSEAKVLEWVHKLIKDKMLKACTARRYSAERPPPAVSS